MHQISDHAFCLWVYFVYPSLTLWHKLGQSVLALIRYLYVSHESCCRNPLSQGWPGCVLLLALHSLLWGSPWMAWASGGEAHQFCIREPQSIQLHLQASQPRRDERFNGSLGREDPSDMHACFNFGLVHLVVFAASLILDLVCYSSIMNYMRKKSIQVAVISVVPSETVRAHNLITAPSNLLIHLVSVATMVPPLILLLTTILPKISSGERPGPDSEVVLSKFQMASVFCTSYIVPLMIIGSSSQLRHDIMSLKKKCARLFQRACGQQEESSAPPRPYGIQEIYTLPPSALFEPEEAFGSQVSQTRKR